MKFAKGEEIRTIVDNNYMTYDEVISNVHMKIGGELLAISMLIPFLIQTMSFLTLKMP